MTFDFGDDFVLPDPIKLPDAKDDEDVKQEKDEVVNEEEKDEELVESENQEEEIDVEEENEESEEDDEEVSEYVKNHFEFMKKEGYVNLPEDYKFDGDLYEVYRKDAEFRQQAVVDGVLGAVDESAKDILSYILNGGTNVQEMVSLTQEQAALENIKIESEEDAERYVLFHLKNNKGLEDDIAEGAITTMKDKGILEETAKKYYDTDLQAVSKEREQFAKAQAKAKADAKASQEAYLNELNANLNAREWEAGAKQKIKQEIYGNATVGKLQHIIANDPNTFLELARILSAYDPEKGLAVVTDKKQKAAAAKAVKQDFFEKAATKKTHSSKGNRRRKKPVVLTDDYEVDINFG